MSCCFTVGKTFKMTDLEFPVFVYKLSLTQSPLLCLPPFYLLTQHEYLFWTLSNATKDLAIWRLLVCWQNHREPKCDGHSGHLKHWQRVKLHQTLEAGVALHMDTIRCMALKLEKSFERDTRSLEVMGVDWDAEPWSVYRGGIWCHSQCWGKRRLHARSIQTTVLLGALPTQGQHFLCSVTFPGTLHLCFLLDPLHLAAVPCWPSAHTTLQKSAPNSQTGKVPRPDCGLFFVLPAAHMMVCLPQAFQWSPGQPTLCFLHSSGKTLIVPTLAKGWTRLLTVLPPEWGLCPKALVFPGQGIARHMQ